MKSLTLGIFATLLALTAVPTVHAEDSLTIEQVTIKTSPACTRLAASLALGSTGESVLALQAYLAARGYLGNESVIGTFGPRTLAAVAKLQTENNLPAVGVVGPLTRALIEKKSCALSVVQTPKEDTQLKLSRIDTPREVERGEKSEWMLTLVAQPTSNTFTYSVIWGDESKAPDEGDLDMDPIVLTKESQLVFTHTYKKAGDYTPIFIVKSSDGRKLRLVSSVTVSR